MADEAKASGIQLEEIYDDERVHVMAAQMSGEEEVGSLGKEALRNYFQRRSEIEKRHEEEASQILEISKGLSESFLAEIVANLPKVEEVEGEERALRISFLASTISATAAMLCSRVIVASLHLGGRDAIVKKLRSLIDSGADALLAEALRMGKTPYLLPEMRDEPEEEKANT